MFGNSPKTQELPIIECLNVVTDYVNDVCSYGALYTDPSSIDGWIRLTSV